MLPDHSYTDQNKFVWHTKMEPSYPLNWTYITKKFRNKLKNRMKIDWIIVHIHILSYYKMQKLLSDCKYWFIFMFIVVIDRQHSWNDKKRAAPFLRVRETYSGLRNCAASHYFLLCCCAAPTLTSSPHYNTVFIFSKLYRNWYMVWWKAEVPDSAAILISLFISLLAPKKILM